eukprot:TRINITY_DN4089_c0_g2_i4.p1 TRINITY_DN4089_c0_g2~~TRINITY_DN4089_c0_g2_i4.p1  ORF type:complete len:219 (-),score=27.92 TRINITY_DN4089_c0_g2_i4:139-795(-)
MGELINTLPIKVVLVSPIQRTLETARILFQTHPNRESIRFIVTPQIMEIMANPDDIPRHSLKRFKDEYSQFDFKLLKNNPDPILYFQDIFEEEDLETINAGIAEKGLENYPEVIADVAYHKWLKGIPHKKKLESFEKGRARAVRFSKWLRTKILDTEGISGSEVMVVSHSVFLAHLVATKFNDYGKAVVPRIKNCDPFKFDLSTIPQQEIIYLSLIHI